METRRLGKKTNEYPTPTSQIRTQILLRLRWLILTGFMQTFDRRYTAKIAETPTPTRDFLNTPTGPFKIE